MKRVILTLAVLIAIPSIATAYCPSCKYGGSYNKSAHQSVRHFPSNNPYTNDSYTTKDDQRIARDIRQSIQRSSLAQANNVQLLVEYGKVTFNGKVDNPQTSNMFEEIALEVPGVYNVVNRLGVESEVYNDRRPNDARDQNSQINDNTSRYRRPLAAREHHGASSKGFNTGAMQTPSNGHMAPALSDQELQQQVENKLTTGWFGRKFQDINLSVSNGTVTLMGQVATETDKKTAERLVREISQVKNVDNQLKVVNALR